MAPRFLALGETAEFLTSAPDLFFNELNRQVNSLRFSPSVPCWYILLDPSHLPLLSKVLPSQREFLLRNAAKAAATEIPAAVKPILLAMVDSLPTIDWKSGIRAVQRKLVDEALDRVALRTQERYGRLLRQSAIAAQLKVLSYAPPATTRGKTSRRGSEHREQLLRIWLKFSISGATRAYRISTKPKTAQSEVQQYLDQLKVTEPELRDLVQILLTELSPAGMGEKSLAYSAENQFREDFLRRVVSEAHFFAHELEKVRGQQQSPMAFSSPKPATPIPSDPRGERPMPRIRTKSEPAIVTVAAVTSENPTTEFKLIFSEEAKIQIDRLEQDPAQQILYQLLQRTLNMLKGNPKHTGLKSHQYSNAESRGDRKVFASHVGTSAYRIYWSYTDSKKIAVHSISQRD